MAMGLLGQEAAVWAWAKGNKKAPAKPEIAIILIAEQVINTLASVAFFAIFRGLFLDLWMFSMVVSEK